MVFEHAEGFGGVVGAAHVGGIEDVAQFVAREAVGAGVEGVEFGAKQRAAVFVPGERRAFVAEVARKRGEGMAGVGEFEDAGNDESEVVGDIRGRRED